MGFCTVWPRLCPSRDGGDKNIQSQFSSSGPMFRLIKKKVKDNIFDIQLWPLLPVQAFADLSYPHSHPTGRTICAAHPAACWRQVSAQPRTGSTVSYYICHHPGSSCCPLHTLTPLYITVDQTQIHWELVLGLGGLRPYLTF